MTFYKEQPLEFHSHFSVVNLPYVFTYEMKVLFDLEYSHCVNEV